MSLSSQSSSVVWNIINPHIEICRIYRNQKKKLKKNEINVNRIIKNIIGFFISLIDKPKQYMAISSLSRDNLKKDNTKPKIIKKGKTILIRFGTINKDRYRISKELILR